MRIRDDILYQFPPAFVILTRENVIKGARVIKNPECNCHNIPDEVGIITNVIGEKLLIRVRWGSTELLLSTLSRELLIDI